MKTITIRPDGTKVNLRTRAEQVYQRGVEERGNFEPTGAPKRVYQYWYRNVAYKRRPERENFCHFWRVVMFWAPLMLARRTFVAVATNPVTMIASAVAAVITLVMLCIAFGEVLAIMAGVLGTCYLSGGMTAGGAIAIDWDTGDNHSLDKKVLAVFAPISLPVFGLVRLCMRYPKQAQKLGIGAGATILVGLVGWILTLLTMETGWTALVGFVGAIVLAFALFVVIRMAADFISGRRSLREQARLAAERAVADAAWKYYEQHGKFPPSLTTSPSQPPAWMVKTFDGINAVGTAIADFIIFFAQLVRVNKWKICPTVTINPED